MGNQQNLDRLRKFHQHNFCQNLQPDKAQQEPAPTIGRQVSLPVSFGNSKNARTEYTTFDVVDLHYPYNAIFRQGFLNKFNVAVHMGYLCMKILALHGVISVHGSQKEARNIEKAIYKSFRNINSMDFGQDEALQPSDMPKGKTDLADQEETKCIPLEEAILDIKIIIAATLSEEHELQLLSTLQKKQRHFHLECLRPTRSQ
jgi:hypothetical protein